MSPVLWEFGLSLECSGDPETSCCTFLPHQTPLGIREGQHYRPSRNWNESFLCLRHGQVFARSAEDVHLEFDTLGRYPTIPPFWQIEAQCARESCGKKHTLYASGPSIVSEAQLVNRILKLNAIVPCDSHDLVWKRELIHGVCWV